MATPPRMKTGIRSADRVSARLFSEQRVEVSARCHQTRRRMERACPFLPLDDHIEKIKKLIIPNPYFSSCKDLKATADSVGAWTWDGEHTVTLDPKSLLSLGQSHLFTGNADGARRRRAWRSIHGSAMKA